MVMVLAVLSPLIPSTILLGLINGLISPWSNWAESAFKGSLEVITPVYKFFGLSKNT